MPNQTVEHFRLANGLTTIIEPMPDVQSAAFTLLVPGGAVVEPEAANGTAAVLVDWMTRGAGDRDSQQFSSALENLGLQHSESSGISHLSFSGATVATNLPAAIGLIAEMIRQPRLPEDQFAAAHAGVEQSLRSIEDEPRQKVMLELRRRTYESPWGRPSDGTLDEMPNVTPEVVRHHYRRCIQPTDCILGVAGRVDPEGIGRLVEQLFGDWAPSEPLDVHQGERGTRFEHLPSESAQTHIGIAYDAVPYNHRDYYAAWAAVGVLDGGMSSRLFTEVREKRGLCYSVSAGLSSLPGHGRVLCYAGSLPERAQETLDVIIQELQKLSKGIRVDELDRCKARAKSSLIMQQESTTARSSVMTRDWLHLGRVVPLSEVREGIEALTPERVLTYVEAHPARDFTVLTIGPTALEVPDAVS